MQKDENPTCQVCFIKTNLLYGPRQLIRCVRCKATAHRFCYLPSCDGDFTCDACLQNFQGNCVICENPGLLKQIDRGFAHPACLLLSYAHIGNCAHMANSFTDLTFMPNDHLTKGPKRTRCDLCGKLNSSVLTCNLACHRNAHIYCSLKSRNSSQGTGWSVVLPFDANSNYSDYFQHIANRKISNHNDFLKKKLTFSKQGKSQHISIYCEQHSTTIPDCRCRTYVEEDKIDWIYCDGCCRWLHLQCVDDQKVAQNAIDNKSQYICKDCIAWKNAVKQSQFNFPSQLPKLHIYDFVFLNHYFEQKKYEVPPQLLEFALKIPILPGRCYIQTQYRKDIAKNLRATIELSDLRKQIEACEGQNSLQKFTKVCIKAKEKLFYMWWLCQCPIINDLNEKIKKQVPFLAKKLEDTLEADTVRQIFEVIIEYVNKFVGGKTQQLALLMQRILGGKKQQRNKSINQNSKERSKSPINIEKTLKIFTDQIKYLFQKMKEKGNKQNATNCLRQLHALINSPQLVPYHDELPNIPIIQACIQFKEKSLALKYISAIANIDTLKAAWKNANSGHSANKNHEKIINFATRFMQTHIIQETDLTLKHLILQQWAKEQSLRFLPSKSLSLSEPESFIPNFTFQSLTKKRINEVLLRLKEQYKTQKSQQIRDFYNMQDFLQKTSHRLFTRQQVDKLCEKLSIKWQGPVTKFIPKIVQQFKSIYDRTQFLLKQCNHQFDPDDCLFQSWSQNNHLKGQHINKYTAYFQDIRDVRLDFFNEEVFNTLKNKIKNLITFMEQKSPAFDNQMQFKILTWWCAKLSHIPDKSGQIMGRDRVFQQSLNMLFPNFENLERISQLERFLSDHLAYFSEHGLVFRVKQIKVISSWIDLHGYVIQRLPPNIILTKEQLSRIQLPKPIQQPDYFILKETLSLMRQLKFPQCEFLKKFVAIVAEGERIYGLIDKVFSYCDWSYDISKEFSDKITRDEFQEIYKIVKQSIFGYKAELIEMDIIRDKFNHVEVQALSLKVQYEQNPKNSAYCQKRAEKLLIIYGSLPILSQQPRFLWEIRQGSKMKGLPENLPAHIEKLERSHRLYSWQTLEFLKNEIQIAIENKLFKKGFVNRLEELMAPNKRYAEKFRFILDKFLQKTLFCQSDIELVGKILEEEDSNQFLDDTVMELRAEYEIYLYAITKIRNHSENRTYKGVIVQFMKSRFQRIHPSFASSEIELFKRKIEENFKKTSCQILNAGLEERLRKGNSRGQVAIEAQMKKEKHDSDFSDNISSKISFTSSMDSHSSNNREKKSESKPKAVPKNLKKRMGNN